MKNKYIAYFAILSLCFMVGITISNSETSDKMRSQCYVLDCNEF